MEFILTGSPQLILEGITAFFAEHAEGAAWFTTTVRFIFPILALLILVGSIRSLLTVPHKAETWAYLNLPNGAQVPLTHWENIVGRGRGSDVQLTYPTVSRQHAALIRSSEGEWTVYDLDSKAGVAINGKPVVGQADLDFGDVLSLGGVETAFLPLSHEEKDRQRRQRQHTRPTPPWGRLLLLTLFQVLTAIQLVISEGSNATATIPLCFFCLSGVMWIYVLVLRALRRVGFEMELIAFFLSTLSLAVVASSYTEMMGKQLLCIVGGVVLFLILEIFLRNLERTQKIRWLMAGAAIGLLGITLVVGTAKLGAVNWISIGGVSIQPSEFAKICYIFAGSATLDRLFRKRNLWLFIILTVVCLGCLALMSDFGTAAIFFATFLVIAYLRSGDFATIALVCGGAASAIFCVIQLKPYVWARFASWGHAWENASVGSGYQQTRTMSAAASGGLIGVGPGEGWLHKVAMGDTDLVFGMLCEEWGLIIAVLAVLCIVTLAVFAVRACRAGRSSFYIIAACAATSLLVFQTCLNVFGAVDLLPLTGVTFPFVSNGGSAMIASWGLLAFLKATDTRPNASLAIRLTPRKEEQRGEQLARHDPVMEEREEETDEED